MRNTFAAILCLLCAVSFSVSAKTKIDIFHAEVPMSTDKNARSIAWGEGLEQVLIRATGDQNIGTNAVIKKAMSRGSKYLSQFKYGTLNDKPSMVMDFNSAQIQELLVQADVSYWPTDRENVLVWLVDDNGSQKEIGWEQSGLQTVSDLLTAGNLSGLPITLPLGDMQDLTNISATDVWGNFTTPISQVSKRYPADSVLVIKVSHRGDQARVDWLLFDMAPEKIAINSQSPLTGSESGTSLGAISKAIAKVSIYYASQNKTKTNQQSSSSGLEAHFSGIKNTKDFYTLETLLSSFNSVASVEVSSIQGSNVSFIVELFGSVDDFTKEAARKSSLTQIQPPVVEESVLDTIRSDFDTNLEDTLTAGVPQQVDNQELTYSKVKEPSTTKQQLWFDVK